MKDEFFWSALGVIWIFGWTAFVYLRRRALDDRSVKLRELLHRERMAAIDKGVPLPEIPAEEEADPVWLRPEAERLRAAWLRRVALVLGLFFVFGGLGLCAGFYWAPDRGFHGMWTLGLIPAMSGIGLLLYALIASKLVVDTHSAAH